MLIKSHSNKYLDDFGLEITEYTVPKDRLSYFMKQSGGTRIAYLYENGDMVKVSSLKSSPVLRVNVLWMTKDLKLRCGVASTLEQKREGLQGKYLDKGEGLFFPYAGPTDVIFHQGSVEYPLDIMFVRGDRITKIEADTEVGGTEKWSCSSCDSVIETQGGFCKENDVSVGDKLVYFAVSKRDERDLQREREESMSFMSLAADLI